MSDLLRRLQAAVGDAYRVERELTRGGMSRLFLATETSLDREVVIKLLPPEWASDVSAERFRQEIQLAAHLQHPNILPVLAAGATGDLVYYVMPYVRGESLRHRLVAEGRLPLPDALRILREVADALAYAHAHGVVHRDIKPENVLLQQGHAVLTDFGVARAVVEARTGGRLTETGMVVGTPGYMSPEQAAGESHIDARADVYALAVVGYEMLAGAPPFTGPTAQAVLAAHLTQVPAPVERLRPETPRPVADTISRALAKSPQERLQNAAEFRDALARASGAVSRPAPPARRRLIPAAIAAVALLIAAVVLWPRGYRVRGDPRHSLIIFPFENRTGDAELDWLEDAAMNSMGLTMAHWEDLRVYDDERTASLMRREQVADAGAPDFAVAQRLAREAGVGTLVLGDIRREGETLVFEAKVHDVASGDRLSTEITRTARTDDPRAAFDSLSARILRVSGAPAGQRPGVVAQTTRSVEAYRAFLAGSAHLQQFQLDSADADFARAVALDSTFALAYVGLRAVEGWRGTGGDPERRRGFIARAERHGTSLPPRLRSLVQFHVAYEADQFQQARAIARDLIARDSTDVEAWYQLGEAHYHHGATRFPHPDTLGNLGTALAAFRRAAALDSSYTLAHRHAADLLEHCARPNVPWACLEDSAAYGTPAALEVQYGEAPLGAARERARAELVRTVQAWTAATPGSPQVRERAVQLLMGQGLLSDAQRQLDALRSLTGELAPRAQGAQATILLAQQRYREAADRLADALARASPAEIIDPRSFNIDALGAAGRMREYDAAFQRVADAVPGGVPVGGGLTWEEMRGTMRVGFRGVAAALRPGTEAATLRAFQRAVADSLRRLVNGDTARARQVVENVPWLLGQYLVSMLDTSMLVLGGDPPVYLGSNRPIPLAIGALQRGDTAGARRTANAAFSAARRTPGRQDEFATLYGSGQLFAALGDAERAVQAYALLDSAPPLVRIAPLHVRSFAERGALYQALGDTRRAIEMYQKFIDAWQDADADLQPMVERARRAVAALRGEAAPEVRR